MLKTTVSDVCYNYSYRKFCALQPRSLMPPYEPKETIADQEVLGQTLLRQVDQHNFYKRMSLEQQRYFIKVGLRDQAAQQAIYA